MSEQSFTPPFILDANVFIQAHRLYYSFDICPGFWDSIIQNYNNGLCVSIDKIRDELEGNDALWQWVKNQLPNDFFKDTNDPHIIAEIAKLSAWAQTQPFTPAAKVEFAQVADAWVLAYCKAKGGAIVTMETLKPEKKNKIQIPNVCEEFSIPWLNTYDMLRETNTRFSKMS